MRSYTGTREAINSTVVTVGGIYLATHSIIVTVAGTIASATHRLDSVADSSPDALHLGSECQLLSESTVQSASFGDLDWEHC